MLLLLPTLCFVFFVHAEANHTYSASVTSPIGRTLTTSRPACAALAVLTRHFEAEAARVYALATSPRPLFIEEREQACNLVDDVSQIASVNTVTSSYGWGVLGAACTTELATDLSAEIVSAMRVYIAELHRLRRRVASSAGLHWAQPRTFMEFKYKGDLESCSLLHFTAFRRFGAWGVNTGITNAGLNVFKEEWRRHYVVEVLRSVKSSNGVLAIAPMLFDLPRLPPASGRENASTTLRSTFGGVPATSLFRSIMIAAKNPAVVVAINVAHDTKAVVQDATTKSNMAILLLPLALAVVPIALFADVSAPVTAAYAAVTDVASALPLAIKGIELIQFGKAQTVATRTWIYGGSSPDGLAAAETWHATCAANGKVIVQGQVFLGLAVLLAVVGGGAEVYFRKAMEKRKRQVQGAADGRGKRARAQAWHKYGGCSECDCGRLGP